MTQAAAKPNPITETHRLSADDAADLERDTGSIVIRLAPTRGEAIWAQDHDLACRLATHLTRRHPGELFGVFKLTRAYHVPEPSPPESEAGV